MCHRFFESDYKSFTVLIYTVGLVYKNLLVDARDRWEIDQAAPQLFFSFFFASQLHTTEAKCQSLERKERKTFNLRLEWEWLYLRQEKKMLVKLMNSIVTTLLLFST